MIHVLVRVRGMVRGLCASLCREGRLARIDALALARSGGFWHPNGEVFRT